MSADLELTSEETKTLKDVLNLVRALTGSLTSEQIVSLLSGINQILPLIQRLGDPDVQALVKTLLESSGTLNEIVSLVSTYHKSGAIKNALELVTLLGTVKNAISTQTISHWAETISRLAVLTDQCATRAGGITGLERLIDSARVAARDTDVIGIVGLLKALKEPQVQKSIKFLLHIARNLDA